MAVSSQRITVGETPTQLNVDADDNTFGTTVTIKPASAIDVGGPAVATGAGYEVGTEGMTFDLNHGDELYGVGPALSSVSVQVLAVGVV